MIFINKNSVNTIIELLQISSIEKVRDLMPLAVEELTFSVIDTLFITLNISTNDERRRTDKGKGGKEQNIHSKVPNCRPFEKRDEEKISAVTSCCAQT